VDCFYPLVKISEVGGDSMSASSFAISAGHGVHVACLNAFVAAALQRVMREAVHVQAPASTSVVPSAGVCVVDLIQVFQVVLPQVLLAVSVNLLQFAVNASSSARLAGALVQWSCLMPGHEPWAVVPASRCISSRAPYTSMFKPTVPKCNFFFWECLDLGFNHWFLDLAWSGIWQLTARSFFIFKGPGIGSCPHFSAAWRGQSSRMRGPPGLMRAQHLAVSRI